MASGKIKNKLLNRIFKKGYKATKYPFLVVIFLVQFIYLHETAMAQSISLDQEWRTDLMRRAQLLGQFDSTVSFLINPVYLNNQNLKSKISNSNQPNNYFQKRGQSFFKKFGYVDLMPVQLHQQYVTDIPFKTIDGPMLASSGYQVMASAGLYAKLGPLTIQLQPQWVHAQNKSFSNNIQTTNYNKLFWGNSSVRLNAGPASIGMSTENISWGPSVFNPLLMSGHAPGFAHLTFKSRRPLKTPIGNIEWQWVAAYLDPMDKAYQGLAEVSAATIPSRRYFNGATLAYQPKWIKGLSVGLTRVVQQPEIILEVFNNWNLIFKNISRANDANEFTDYLLNSVESNTDQYASFFMRYLMQPANAEFYMEWGRNDAFYNFRDAIQRLDHSRAYTLGVRKLFQVNADKTKYWQIISEYTRMQQPPSWPLLSGGSWYVHGGAAQGYTHLGEIMGAPIGQGANAQTFRLSKFNGLQQYGIQLERVTQNGVYFEDNLAFTNPAKTKWVDFGLRLLADHPFKRVVLSSSIAYKKSFNYQWTQPADATGLGFNNPNDLNSFMFKLGIWFR
jgi:hypothetical protein